jgi:predicted nucleic acid-binding protein
MFGGIRFDGFNEKTKERIADIEHLLAHILAKRDFFITSDEKHFIKNREKLKAEFGVEIMRPEDFMEMYEGGKF